jgi:type III pantothenate kinase
MILAIDVGNTNIVLGLMDGERVVQTFRISTQQRTTDELGLLMVQLFAHQGVTKDQIDGAIVSTVVPSVLYTIDKACRRYLDRDLLVVGKKLKTGVRVRTDNPREVGADRIVNAAAAIHKWGAPIVVVDLGTATTFDCVDSNGDYIGGAIAPGFKISEEALVSRTAQLPRVELVRPPAAIGRNTVHAMQAGLIFGYAGLCDALARRCKEELGGTAKVVATGGLATLVARESEVIEEVDAYLTLRGLALLWARNQSS